jgi:Ni/Fe-hydrogenase subunit HybB-like protein
MGFIYPNEAVLEWDLLIVIYPYITGLVAGAFIVSSLYHVFGVTKLKSVARFSLVAALAFLVVAPIPLTVHLGHPERALEMFIRPNFTSAMSGFGFIWMFYLILVLAEVWLVFRPDIVRYALRSTGVKKTLYSMLALNVYDLSEKALATDRKIIKILAFAGIPAACVLHGYVGFIFGAIKANPWWSTPLMPIIFLISAIVSGIALLIVLYIVVTKLRKAQLDRECVDSMVKWLGGFLALAIVIEGLEIFSRFYESEESWTIISQLISQKLVISYAGVQYAFGMVIPLLILGGTFMIKMSSKFKLGLQFFSSIAVLIGVFAMRWNVVIGGQLVSKSLRGFSDYVPPLLGLSGIVTATLIMLLPFVIFAVLAHFIPPWQEGVEHDAQQGSRYANLDIKRN